MPALITLIIPLINGLIAAAPGVIGLIETVKTYVGGLFTAGLIDKPTQDALMAHVDAVNAAVIAGTPPPHWTIEPDPE